MGFCKYIFILPNIRDPKTVLLPHNMLKIINPYPGFENGFYRPYLEDESSLFFGRKKDISTLKLKIRQRKLISLIAEPKMGKTSLIRSGLIPDLRNNNFDGFNGKVWKCVYMMPDQNPIHALAKAIVNPTNKISDKIKPSMEEEVYAQLLKNDYGLVRVIESIIGDRNINILIAIDDFIDLFNSDVDQRQRTKFLRLIHKAYIEKSLPLFIITSFNKEDFKDPRLRQEPKLHKALNIGVHKLNYLDNMGLQDAIMEPAKIANSNVALDLGKEMMLMLLQDNDQLRKLQLLMSRTWMEWKRNHKDKTISKAHYFRATGQKSKAVAKGLMKGGKISVDHLETLAKESAKADNSQMAQADYRKLNDNHKALFKRIVPHLVDDSGKDLKAVNIDRKKAGELLGISMEELGMLVTEIPTIIAMDKKKISINDITIFNEWDEIKQWIRNSNMLKMKFVQIADAAILHYIDGIDLKSVISRSQYKEIFQYIDLNMVTPSWAMAQHDQYELGLDFIGKLVETYGEVALKASSKGVKKKLSFGSSKKGAKADDVVSNESLKHEEVDDEQARKEALAILGMADDSEAEEAKPTKKKMVLGAKPKKEKVEEKSSGSQAPIEEPQKAEVLDEEDEAIRKLLGNKEKAVETNSKAKTSKKPSIVSKPKTAISLAKKQTIASKPKPAIVPEKKQAIVSKPKPKPIAIGKQKTATKVNESPAAKSLAKPVLPVKKKPIVAKAKPATPNIETKKKIAIKPKAKIVLGAKKKENTKEKVVIKPKIVIKKK